MRNYIILQMNVGIQEFSILYVPSEKTKEWYLKINNNGCARLYQRYGMRIIVIGATTFPVFLMPDRTFFYYKQLKVQTYERSIANWHNNMHYNFNGL